MSETTGKLMKVLEAFEGTSDGVPGSCPYPVNEPMIHHWCDAIGDRNRSYLEAEFARHSVHGGIVAPPTMLRAWTMRGLRPGTAEEAAAAGDKSEGGTRKAAEPESPVGPRIAGGRPRPSLNQDVAFFWEGAAESKLLVQKYAECETQRHPPGPGYPQCSCMEWAPATQRINRSTT